MNHVQPSSGQGYGQPPSGQGYGQPPSRQGLGLPLPPSSGSGPLRLPLQPGAGFGLPLPKTSTGPGSPIQPSVSPGVRSPGPGQPSGLSPVKIQQQALFGSPNKPAVLLAQPVEVVKPPPAGALGMALYAVRMRDRHERDEKERVVKTHPDLLLPCPLRCKQTVRLGRT